jgi:anti-anti-sigma regulatory factor
MLRISVLNGSGTTRFKLEGKLAHEWVREAEVAWTAHTALNGKKKVIVDLYDVCFVDEAGHQLLADMHRAGGKLVGSGPMMSALIEEIREAERAKSTGSERAEYQVQDGVEFES